MKCWVSFCVLTAIFTSISCSALPGNCCSAPQIPEVTLDEIIAPSLDGGFAKVGNYEIVECGAQTLHVAKVVQSLLNILLAIDVVMSTHSRLANTASGPIQLLSVGQGLSAFFRDAVLVRVQEVIKMILKGQFLAPDSAATPKIQCITDTDAVAFRNLFDFEEYAFGLDKTVFITTRFFDVPLFTPGNQKSFDNYQTYVLISALAQLYLDPTHQDPYAFDWNECNDLTGDNAISNPKSYQLLAAYVQQSCTQIPVSGI